LVSNPLKRLEQEYILLILQFLHLNPNGKGFSQICSSIEHDANPKSVTKSLKTLIDLGLIFEIYPADNEDPQPIYVLSNRGRYASEIVWDLFRVILNPHESLEDSKDSLDFYR
jgi:DNA-binding HxlR family transcriptional regulator